MKTIRRDRKIIFYANKKAQSDKTDEFGNITGVPGLTYDAPVCYRRLSAPRVQGAIQAEAFGLTSMYQTTFVTADMNCPLEVDTRLWIDTPPYDQNGNELPHNYVVKAIFPTTTAIKVIAEEVSVS